MAEHPISLAAPFAEHTWGTRWWPPRHRGWCSSSRGVCASWCRQEIACSGTVGRARHRGCHGAFPAPGPTPTQLQGTWGCSSSRSAQCDTGAEQHRARLRSGSNSPARAAGKGGAWCEGHPAPGVPRLPASLPAPCPQVLLAALRLAASESQPLGDQDRVVLQGQRVLVQPPARPQRHTARPRCPAGMNWIEGTHQCCTPCPAGESCPASMARHAAAHQLHCTGWPCSLLSPQGHSCEARAQAAATTASAILVPPVPSVPSPTPSASARLATSATVTVSRCCATRCCAVPCSACAVLLTTCLLQLSRAC